MPNSSFTLKMQIERTGSGMSNEEARYSAFASLSHYSIHRGVPDMRGFDVHRKLTKIPY